MDEYVVWSCVMHGWWGKGGTYVSALGQAQRFLRQPAIEFCKKRYTPGNDDVIATLPVRLSDIEAIKP